MTTDPPVPIFGRGFVVVVVVCSFSLSFIPNNFRQKLLSFFWESDVA